MGSVQKLRARQRRFRANANQLSFLPFQLIRRLGARAGLGGRD